MRDRVREEAAVKREAQASKSLGIPKLIQIFLIMFLEVMAIGGRTSGGGKVTAGGGGRDGGSGGAVGGSGGAAGGRDGATAGREAIPPRLRALREARWGKRAYLKNMRQNATLLKKSVPI